MKNKEAFILFFSKEWKQLLGKRSINLIILSTICAIALLSIGFAIAGLSYLEKKMSDPFVTCVDIEVDQVWGDGFDSLSDFIEDPTNQEKLGFSKPEQVFLFRETFYDTDNKQVTLDGRTFSASSPIKQSTILSETNTIFQTEDISDFDFGLILSRNALRKLGYIDDSIPSFLQQNVWLSDGMVCRFNVPVLAVVHELPNMSDFLATSCYAQQEISENAEHFDISKRDDDLIICYPSELADSVMFDIKKVDVVENQPYKLGYPNDSFPTFLQQKAWLSDTLQYHFNVPILAIVHELPNMSDFLSTLCYAQQVIAEDAEQFDISKRDDDLIICYPNKLADSVVFDMKNVDVVENQPYKWSIKYYQVRIKSNTAEDCASRAREYDSIFSNVQKNIPSAMRLYDFNYDPDRPNDRDPQLYSCYFEREELQDKVERFRSELDKETNYKLDMSKINNLKNLAHIQHIGKTLSYCITGISILFIVVFLYFLLNMHFQKIQRNIGTFKAFGVDNLTLYQIYILIVFCIITSSLLFAGVTSYAFEILTNSISPIEGTENRIDIFVWQNALLVALVYICSFLSTFYVVHSKLRHTPGDLIYNRNQN